MMRLAIDSPSAPSEERLQVGNWMVEPALNQLSAAGKTVKLEPKTMAVLIYLANRPGQVVSREALLSALWPGIVVGDDSLTQVVIKLRKALGDDPEEPAHIQTITKGGYRLVAPVVRPVEVSSKRLSPDLEHSSLERRIPWMAGTGIAALLVAAGFWWITGGHVLRLSPDQLRNTSIETARTEQPTLAVAPFEALGNDAQEVLLARGITADLLTDLSKVSGLSVIGFAPIDGRARSEGASQAQAIRYQVSGTVQNIDGHLRLHVYLMEQETGKQLWSERFDRALSDFFAIQNELGPKIVGMLPAKVSQAELQRMAQRHTRNLEAYGYFQRGQSALLIRQSSANKTAREMFRRAMELDPTFARAYAGLALTYAADYRNQWSKDSAAALDRAFELARTALQINPDVPETYWALAYVHAQRRQHEQALKYLETAVRLYPSFADGYALMGSINTFAGRPADSVPLIRTAMRLDPKSGYLYFLVLGRAYLFLGDLEQARVNLEEALRRNPEYLETHVYAAALHAAAGNKTSAAWEAEEIRALQPGFSGRRWVESYPMTDSAQKRKLVQALAEAGL
jgi:TolB-like protein/DNA-binding winged helix-turn-helix (wHTH) protein/Tfp pilus assembly protein PilF